MKLSAASLYAGSAPIKAVYRGAGQIWRQKTRSFVHRFTAWNSQVDWTTNPSFVRISSGRLEVDSTTAWDHWGSVSKFDLTESSVMVEVVQYVTSASYCDTYFVLSSAYPNGGQFNFDIESTGGGNYGITFFWLATADAEWEWLPQITYNATTMRWLRFRHTGTSVYAETSPDAITWTTRWTWTPPFPIDYLGISLGAGGDVTTGRAIFDNLNVYPA